MELEWHVDDSPRSTASGNFLSRWTQFRRLAIETYNGSGCHSDRPVVMVMPIMRGLDGRSSKSIGGDDSSPHEVDSQLNCKLG